MNILFTNCEIGLLFIIKLYQQMERRTCLSKTSIFLIEVLLRFSDIAKIKIRSACLLGLIVLIGNFVHGQEVGNIYGRVTDDKGIPLATVSINIRHTNQHILTDSTGNFYIKATSKDTLDFSLIGYLNYSQVINNGKYFPIQLIAQANSLNEVIVVGYGSQEKRNLTSAVSSIKGDAILTTKNENIQNMLTGKVPGLRVVQNSSEPGSFDNSFNIRGFGSPLIIIDGIPRDNMTRIDPNDVENISVLKDASAAVYGVRAANGVVLITTKKGKAGTTQMVYSGNFGWQVPSGLPKPVGAIDYMTLVNELTMHDINNPHLTYFNTDFDAYKNGTKKSTDWYNNVIKKSFAQDQHNLNISGGTDKINYFFSLGYLSQQGMFKSNDLNYKKYNVRSNISAKVTKDLMLELNMSAIMDQKFQPYSDAWWIIRSFWRQLPTQTVYANNNPSYLNNGLVDGTNPVALMNSDLTGYKKFTNRWFQSSIMLTYKFPFLKGLDFKALYSYDYKTSDNKYYQKKYSQYAYNEANNSYTEFINQSPSTLRREYYSYPQDLERLTLNYNRNFNNTHNVTALLLYEQSSSSGDNFYAQRELALPIDQLMAGNTQNQQGNMSYDDGSLYQKANKAIVGRAAYDYKSKYLFEFSFRRDGSSKFSAGKQWGFFPVYSVGWVISEEKFWKNSTILSAFNFFKVRGSYGTTGDDGASSYQFISGYNYPAGGSYNGQPGGSVFNGSFVNAVSSTGIPNPNITWYTSKTFDLGLDMNLWHNALTISIDYFNRNRNGLLTTRLLSLPDEVGASLPQENLNSDQTRGGELNIGYKNRIGDFTYSVNGNMAYTRTKNLYIETARTGNSYLNWRNNSNNRYNNTYWGYGAGGIYTDYQSIINSPVYVGRGTVVGDYIYQDWNGDGVIDDLDTHPIGYTGDPLLTYGLTLQGSYKGFDLNLLFQGAGMANVSYFEQLNTPLWGGGSALSQYLDRYHPVDPTANPYNPNTQWASGHFAYTGSVPNTNSTFNMQNGAYLRLKSAELGYTLPFNLLAKLGVKGLRIYANGYNILTVTKLKYVDPEHPSSTYGYVYPLNKVFSFGLNVKF